MSAILSCDLGTTGNRAILFSESGEELVSHYEEFPQYYPQAAWVEHDALEIWNSCLNTIQTVVAQSKQPIKGLAITNQRETTVLWNKKTGQPIHNAIVWQCRRSTDRCHALADKAQLIRQKTGLPLDPYFSATKIEWLLQNVEGATALAEQGDLCFGTIDTWVLWNLTNGTVHATDASNASRTMLYNIHDQRWDPDLLALFQIPESILPTVYDSNHHFATVSILDHDIPILSILGDQQAALFAQCGHDLGKLKNTYGTGLFMMAYTGANIAHTQDCLTTIAWSLNGTVSYALEGAAFVGGSVIQWLRDELGLIQSAEESSAIAHQLKCNDGVYFVPALTGLGAPHWDSQARGLLIGLTRGTGKAHIVRAALESLAYQSQDICRAMSHALPNLSFSALRVDGGASQNDFLMQFQSDLLGIPVEQAAISESTAFGVAGMAGIEAGIWSDADFRSLIKMSKTYHVKEDSKTMSAYYDKWTDAIQRSRAWAI